MNAPATIGFVCVRVADSWQQMEDALPPKSDFTTVCEVIEEVIEKGEIIEKGIKP